ncbi:hypothetical protein CDL12_13651 [Handroanthus impetiginosus]|uniref:DUF7870 domain-containing protein n=1 Tax=Handroanthus impetiginosus TaxID=429701 RepID=A0A2G9H8A0_9LAMI|nr:hypothetical protein CDL12_13651 [Handroanthus impetiginosus]
MNPRKPNTSKYAASHKLVVYGVVLMFLVLISLAMIKDKLCSNTPNLTSGLRKQVEYCKVPDHKKELIRNLEPLIAQEPLDIWEGLGKEEKNIKYLPSIMDLSSKDRFIYIDLGAREYDSSIGSWFLKQYPKQNKTFEIYAVEADKSFHKEYKSRKGVTLLPYAAWIRNETVVFGSKPIIVKDKVWRMRPFGRIEGQKAQEDKRSAVVKVQAFDFVDWLKRTIKPTDFVVVKMDVEGTEVTLIRELVERGAICLIDELFMECHFDRYVKCCSGERINRFNFSYDQCYNMFSELRKMGSFVHQWWIIF